MNMTSSADLNALIRAHIPLSREPYDWDNGCIRSNLRRANQDVAVLRDTLRELAVVSEVLERHLEELEDVIAAHPGVLTGIGHLPVELLIMIFDLAASDPHLGMRRHPFSHHHPIRCIMQTCTQWRTLVINRPSFWSTVVQTPYATLPSIRRQLERVANAPLCVWSNARKNGVNRDDQFLYLVGARSSQWHEAHLNLTARSLRTLSEFVVFPILRTMSLYVYKANQILRREHLPRPSDGVNRFPALKNVTLNLEDTEHSDLVLELFSDSWSGLRYCALEHATLQGVLRILDAFGPDCRLILRYNTPVEDWELSDASSQRRVPVHFASLELARCDPDFMVGIMNHIGSSPSFKSLKIVTAMSETLKNAAFLAALDANPCQLDELHVVVLGFRTGRIREPRDLGPLLDSSPIRGITNLTLNMAYDLPLDDAMAFFSQRLASGAADSSGQPGPALVPNLRRLALLVTVPLHITYTDPSHAAVCALHETRKDVLKELVTMHLPMDCEEDGPEIKKLRELGLEVMAVDLDELVVMTAEEGDPEGDRWDIRSNASEEA
ncbi:F-box domain-containing protein [Mycena chlorophos]|uniref:F-box domain-containing protein n=1 Tax=Mycena chlorophos TaxID=658473 RepID=A0A8H6S047_MYCCL|nr:F-box domain-containing protein [Mycena chlorophos]